jgi:predicted ATPase/class 3 adenylate cyclase
MSFLDTIERARAYLERHHRVSLRALRREYGLDDDAVEELVEELVEVQAVAALDGKTLTWTGEDTGASRPAGKSEAEIPVPPSVREAERRQLSVMFCDLVGSTALSERLDPEELREVVQAHRSACAAVIARFEGYLAKYLGDGMLVHFGYPQAHEDDAERAVRAGLALVTETGQLNTRLEEKHGIRLAVRVGIHTGLVVAGEMGAEAQREELGIIGETPNIAARIEGVAAPDTVAISATTLRLVSGVFITEDLGTPPLKGVSEPLRVHRVVQPSGVRSRLDLASGRLTPYVGRQEEVGLLLGRWEQVEENLGQVVHISGEPGVGKSRLVQVLRERLAETPHTWLECSCSPYAQGSAFHPVIELVQQGLTFAAEDSAEDKLYKLERGLELVGLPPAEMVPLFAPLLSMPLPDDRYAPLGISRELQRQKTLEALVAWSVALGERQPLLMLYEDLHWCDPSTLELLRLSVEQVPTTRILLLLTSRPEFEPDWPARSHHTPIVLNRLSARQARAMVTGLAPARRLPDEVIKEIVSRADGMPLFVEELSRTVIESGLLEERDGRYILTKPLSDLAIPTTLQDSLMARLDRLSAAKDVAQLAATLGRDFSYELLEAVSPAGESTLRHGLGALVDAEVLHRRGVPPQATYIFKHNLVQEAAYQSLLKSTRRTYHEKIAAALAERFPETVENQPELLAHHYTEAGAVSEAIVQWHRAGREAARRSANAEAAAHLSKGIDLLDHLPATTERDQLELRLQLDLGPPLMASKGYAHPDVEHAYGRARELCREVGATVELFQALTGLSVFYMMRAELGVSHEIGLQVLDLAERLGNSTSLTTAHSRHAETLYWLGEPQGVLEHTEKSIKHYQNAEREGRVAVTAINQAIASQAFRALAQWQLGYPDRASQEARAAVERARSGPIRIVLAHALAWSSMLRYLRGEFESSQDLADETIEISRDKGFPFWLMVGQLLRDYAHRRLSSHDPEAAKDVLNTFENAYERNPASRVGHAWFFALALEAYRPVSPGEDQWLASLDRLLSVSAGNGGHVWDAELYRLKGTLLLDRGDGAADDARGCFCKALEVSRGQAAKSLELRATTSLARLLREQGKIDEARQTLAPVYDWFTEGFDTRDLTRAKQLLTELS